MIVVKHRFHIPATPGNKQQTIIKQLANPRLLRLTLDASSRIDGRMSFSILWVTANQYTTMACYSR
jgi:hypothetical protein